MLKGLYDNHGDALDFVSFIKNIIYFFLLLKRKIPMACICYVRYFWHKKIQNPLYKIDAIFSGLCFLIRAELLIDRGFTISFPSVWICNARNL